MSEVFSPDAIVFYLNVGILTFVVRFLLDWSYHPKSRGKLWEGRWMQHE